MSDRKVTPAPKAYRANVFWDRQDCATLSAQVYLASDADSFISALLAEHDQLRSELEAIRGQEPVTTLRAPEPARLHDQRP